MPFDPSSPEPEDDVPPSEIVARAKRVAQWIDLDVQQAAQLFRSLVKKGACQYECGRMRWWLEAGLALELSDDGKWTLWVVPTRGLPRPSREQRAPVSESAGHSLTDQRIDSDQPKETS